MDKTYDDALVALASVGAVIWTGGLIVRQLYPTTLTIGLQDGMFFAMMTVFASVAGLFMTLLALQSVAGFFLLLYGYQYFVDCGYLYRLNAGRERVPSTISDVPRYYNDVYLSTRLGGFLLLPYPVVMIWPT
jgi:hypothetical protein